jgi:hypothetical protein
MRDMPGAEPPVPTAIMPRCTLRLNWSKTNRKIGVVLPGSQKTSRYTLAGGDTSGLAAPLA